MKIMNDIFAFTLYTKSVFRVNCCIFDTNGKLIGKILSKYPNFRDSYDEFEYKDKYSYNIESSKGIYEKLLNNEIRIYGINDYKLSSCNTHYVHKEENKNV